MEVGAAQGEPEAAVPRSLRIDIADARDRAVATIEDLARRLAGLECLPNAERLDDLEAAISVAFAVAEDGDRPLRVVLEGRTMAGKSTLFEALTGGDGSRVGIGKQRTTTGTLARHLIDIPGVELVDVPGVGALQGDEDVVLAHEEVPGADLIVWVASTESIQDDTGRSVRHLATLGKPVAVVVNCLRRLDLQPHRRAFLADPGRLFAQAADHVALVAQHLHAEGGDLVTWVPLHAKAALLGRLEDDPALEKASNIAGLVDLVATESCRAPERRFLADVDRTRALVVDAIAEVAERRLMLDNEEARARGRAVARHSTLTGIIKDAQDNGAGAIQSIIDEGYLWYLSVDLDRSVNDQWQEECRRVEKDLRAAVDQASNDLAYGLAQADADVIADWQSTPSFQDLPRDRMRLPGMGPVAAKLGVRIAIATAGLALAFVPGGQGASAWAIAASLGGTAAIQIGLNRAWRWIDKRLPGVAQRDKQRREGLRDKTREWFDAARAAATKSWADRCSAAQEMVETAVLVDHQQADRLFAAASASGDAERSLRGCVMDLDAATARGQLCLDGRPGLAAAVVCAHRTPGLATIIVTDSVTYPELVLHPPKSAEPVVVVTASPHEAPIAPALRAAPQLRLEPREMSPTSARFESAGLPQQRCTRVAELLTRLCGDNVNVQVVTTSEPQHPSASSEEGP